MVTWAEVKEQARRGSLGARLILDVTELPRSRLDGWHRRKIVHASVWPGRRGMPRIYAWSDYAKIRAAQQFLERGVGARDLRCMLNRLDWAIRDWHELTRHDHRAAEIVRCNGEFRYEIRLPSADGAQRVAAPGTVYASDGDELLIEIAEHLRDEGPLARLKRFEPWVDMRPEVQGGDPTLRGSRILTALLAEAADAGNSPDEIAGELEIDPTGVAKGVEFQRELTSRRPARE